MSPLSGARKGRQPLKIQADPIVGPYGRITVGTLDGFLATTATNLVESFTDPGVLTLTAAPTRHKDGSLLVVGRGGYVVKLGVGTTWRKTLEGASIAP